MYSLLVVDDERLVVDSLAETIPWSSADIGEVYKAYSAGQALQIMKTQSVDIVLTDIRMPEMSGLELIESIRSLNKRTKCIVHTGYSDFNYARQAMSSQVMEYLLKPASDEEIVAAVRRMAEKLGEEWAQVISLQRASAALREHEPLLRANLLHDLIKGKRMRQSDMSPMLDQLKLPFRDGDVVSMMIVRLEEDFSNHDVQSLSLFEYAISNIAEETMEEHFHIWGGKDAYDYLVFLVKLNERMEAQLKGQGQEYEKNAQLLLEQTAVKFQSNVRSFLKGKISLVLSPKGVFPHDVGELYQQGVASIRRNVGNDEEVFLTISGEPQNAQIQSMQALYEPPTIMQLMEMGKREQTIQKLLAITHELEERWRDSYEHLMEVFYSLSAAFVYAVHKNGKTLEGLLQDDYEPLFSRKPFLSVKQLREWALQVADKLFDDLSSSMLDNKTGIIKQIQNYVSIHLATDVSLQTIADHIHLHPVYLSKIFKSETGENLSEYVIRLKMEKAAYLLKHTDDRIYEICSKIGYQNPPHFIKVFKRTFGVTPQEYRDARHD